MTKRYLTFSVLMIVWGLVLGAIAKTSLDRLAAPSWGNPVGAEHSPEIVGDTRVGQSFISQLPGLFHVEVALDATSVAPTRQITFHLKEDPDAGSDLWTGSLRVADIQNGNTVAFEFPPIRDSKDREFYFYLESAESTPGDAVFALYSASSTVDGASAYVDDAPVAGNLRFQTFYTLRTREKIDLLLTQMTAGRPYLLGNKAFYVGLAFAYALFLGLLLWQVARIILKEQQDVS